MARPLPKFRIIENGVLISTAKTPAEWKKIVRGLNSAMDCVDAPYAAIEVRNSKNRLVYKQERTDG